MTHREKQLIQPVVTASAYFADKTEPNPSRCASQSARAGPNAQWARLYCPGWSCRSMRPAVTGTSSPAKINIKSQRSYSGSTRKYKGPPRGGISCAMSTSTCTECTFTTKNFTCLQRGQTLWQCSPPKKVISLLRICSQCKSAYEGRNGRGRKRSIVVRSKWMKLCRVVEIDR